MAIPQSKICRQYKEHEYPDWLELPEDVLEVILQKLPLIDCLSFCNVCKLWRIISLEALRSKRSCGLPWLVMSGQTRTKTRSCFSILESKLWQMEIPKSYGGYFWGSFDNWLIMVKSICKHFQRIHISLLNPFSGAEILLPSANSWYDKLVWSGNPRDKDCMYMLLSWPTNDVAFWMKGVQGWYECELETEGDQDMAPFVDAISFKDCFYLLTEYYSLQVVEISSASSAIKQKNSTADGLENPSVVIKTRFFEVKMDASTSRWRNTVVTHLMEFHGEILLVCRFLNNTEDTVNFKIYKLDFRRMVWVKLNSLEDQVLFVGKNCSRCFSVKEVGDFAANCIYFTSEFGPLCINEWDFDDNRVGSQTSDWSIFRLGSHRLGRFSYRAKIFRWPPIWITAPLWWYYLLGNKP